MRIDWNGLEWIDCDWKDDDGLMDDMTCGYFGIDPGDGGGEGPTLWRGSGTLWTPRTADGVAIKPRGAWREIIGDDESLQKTQLKNIFQRA